MTIDDTIVRQGLEITLDETELDGLGVKYRGKVRDNYSSSDGKRYIVVTDRISAFDRILGTLPFKGQVLNQLAAWWFEQTRSLVPNHMLGVPDPNVMQCVECEPLAVEMVVRAYLTGVSSTSVLTAYERGEREFCGHRLPDGLRRHERLPEPIVTPTTKAPQGQHDENVSREQIIAMGKVSAEDFDQAARYALSLFSFGTQVCRDRGLLLVDTKYEFGKTKEGQIVLIDEIHTPDSSRYWFTESYDERFARGETPESFDKEYVRRWLKEQGYQGEGPSPPIPDQVRIEASKRYIEACDVIRGEAFEPDLQPPHTRIRKNLGLS